MSFDQWKATVSGRLLVCVLFLLAVSAPGSWTPAAPFSIAPLFVTGAGGGLQTTGQASPSPDLSFAGITPAGGTPPDSHGAVGPGHVLTQTNGYSVIRDRAGNLLANVALFSFWSSLGVTDVFDPKVLYDPFRDRFIAVACAQRRTVTSGMLFGVSATPDPTGAWHLWLLDADPTNHNWVDYPGLGMTADRFTISGNLFSTAADAFGGVNLWVVDKDSALDGGALSLQLLKVDNAGGTLVPALTHDAQETVQYLVRTGTGNIFGLGRLQVYGISGTLGELVFTQAPNATLGPGWSLSLPNASQPGTTATIETNDDRLMNAVLRNGQLWTTHTVALGATNPNHTAVKWWNVSPGSGLAIQSGVIEDVNVLGQFDIASGAHYYYPSIAVNENNEALIGFTGSGGLDYPSAFYAFRPNSAGPGLINQPFRYKAGPGPFGGPRWGDYSHTVVDPVDDGSFWTVQQYAMGSNQTGNFWARIQQPLSGDTYPPTALFGLDDPNPTRLDTVTFRVDFSESVGTSFGAADVVVTGTLAAGASVQVTGGPIRFAVDITPQFANGDGTIGIALGTAILDLAGNAYAGGSAPESYTLDNTAPAVTVHASLTKDRTPALTGSINEVSATVSVSVGGQSLNATNEGDGTWLLEDDELGSLADGTYDVVAVATDAAGNSGSDTTSNELTIDATAPSITVYRRLTNDSTPPLAGTVSEPGATISVSVAGQSRTARNNGNGSWILQDGSLSVLQDGVYSVVATATDAAGNTGVDSNNNELTVDTTAPTLTVSALLTNDNRPPLSGTTSDFNAVINISLGGQSLTATNHGNGTWSLADNAIPAALADGAYDVVATSTDAAGNTGIDNTSNELSIDTTAPVLTLLGAASVAVECGTPYQDAGATASDNRDGSISAWIVNGGLPVNTDVPAVHQVTYNVSDTAGNSATQLSRTVQIGGGDSDGDGLDSCDELNLGTDPLRSDTDGDGLPDGFEVESGTDPLDDQSFSPDVYVDGASGSDDTGFGTMAQPWATVGHAAARVQGSLSTTIRIHVAEGTYTDLGESGGPLVLDSHEHVLGGYEASGWTRDTRRYITVLDASVADNGSPADNAVILDGIANAVLDGFTVTHADSSGTAALYAAGILCIGIDQTSEIRDCLILGNTSGANGSGAAMLVDASPAITGCTLAGNATEGRGGGLGIEGNSLPAITRCTIGGNSSDLGGGGIYVGPAANPLIANSIIAGNASPQWFGGGILFDGGSGVVANCTIAHNVSDAEGGGGVALLGGFPLLVNCVFAENDGAAIAQLESGAPPLVEYCLFGANAGGAYYDFNEGTPVVHLNASGINLGVPGAAGNVDGDPLFRMAPAGTWTSGPAYNASTHRTTLTNTAATLTAGAHRGGLIALSPDGTLQALVLDNTSTTVEVSGDYSSLVASGNAYQFVDYRLEAGSAAIDTGRDTSTPDDGGIALDFDDVVRGFDGDGRGAVTADGSDYDAGAFERDVPAIVHAVTILSPNGGETFARGQTTEVRWTSSGNVGPNVRITARKGTSSANITNSTPNDGSHIWQVPSGYPLGPGMYLEISSTTTPSILDVCDGTFTIIAAPIAPTITVTAPNGGESFIQGARVAITWLSSDTVGSNVQILAHGAGQTFTLAATTANDGAFDWTVPLGQVAGTDYTIEVRSAADPAIKDSSDAPFSINAAPPAAGITVLAPNGGETFTRGQTIGIAWTSTGDIGANVKIVARKGTTSSVIAVSTPNDGSHTFQIPSFYPLGPGMYIEISSVATPSILDNCDQTFTIVQ